MFKIVVACTFAAFIGLISVESCDFQDKPCPMPYTKKMQDDILKYHNDVRSKASPTAKNMQKMYWDDNLAKTALAHSAKCKFEHDTSADRRFAGYLNVGQNIFAGSARPSAVSPGIGWYSEVKWFKFGQRSSHTVGHYTQVMQGAAARIGCGGAYCPNLGLRYLVTCNYLKGQYNYITPYSLGKPCGACPKSCKNNLCDCGGKVCQRDGVLDINTCKCRCPMNTKGEMCEKVDCEIKEKWHCKFYSRYCSLKYGYRILNMCPKSCKLC